MPQKEGMKSAKHWFEKKEDGIANARYVAGGAFMGATGSYLAYPAISRWLDERRMPLNGGEVDQKVRLPKDADGNFIKPGDNLIDDNYMDEILARRSSAATVDRMNSISRKVFGDTSEFTQKASDYSKYADDADDADRT